MYKWLNQCFSTVELAGIIAQIIIVFRRFKSTPYIDRIGDFTSVLWYLSQIATGGARDTQFLKIYEHLTPYPSRKELNNSTNANLAIERSKVNSYEAFSLYTI